MILLVLMLSSIVLILEFKIVERAPLGLSFFLVEVAGATSRLAKKEKRKEKKKRK